jgi:hypothetical protein
VIAYAFIALAITLAVMGASLPSLIAKMLPALGDWGVDEERAT